MTDVIKTFFNEALDTSAAKKIIGYKNNEELHKRDFIKSIQQAAGFFSKQRAQTWAVFCDNSWDFSIAIFALLVSGKNIVLPGNWQGDTQEKIAQLTDGIIVASNKKTTVQCTNFYDLLKSDIAFCLDSVAINNSQSISIFTSGSTGEPKLITKQWHHFTSEIADLEKMWGGVVAGSVFAATVSHQHIYGFLFKVLWPILTGRPFHTELFQYPEELIRVVDNKLITLVSSPAQLKRLPGSNQSENLKNKFAAVFSSGGALPIEANKEASNIFNCAVTEVFGSSETGGVAFRQAVSSGLSWQRFPSVKIKQSPQKNLAIKSPFIAVDSFYVMSDEIELIDEDYFILHGRSDRIVKIEEKRLSLDAMEAKLLSHAFVKGAAVTVLDGRRQIVVAAIELNGEGVLQLKAKDKKWLVSALKQQLLQEFERVVLPKKWRFISSIPTNTQGKRLDAEIKALFLQEPFLQNLPKIITIEKKENIATVVIDIPETLPIFSGHFDDYKVLPGIQQSLWIINYCRECFFIAGEVLSLERLKFHSVVRPNDQLNINMQWNENENKVSVSCYCGSVMVSSGVIAFSKEVD